MSHQTTDRGECSPTIKLRPAEDFKLQPLREPVPALVDAYVVLSPTGSVRGFGGLVTSTRCMQMQPAL
ncbi:hypothetical protein GGX14DRAFT_557787 [Mycena pura]|uniref:Uncharacterized protein n=1 Tax=Mycena pura TaxID=153505 RepID=A0AAD6YLU6_9AGAR|nr:hypothetical protein GGX14DRAFT_557787 [Mycena pura]